MVKFNLKISLFQGKDHHDFLKIFKNEINLESKKLNEYEIYNLMCNDLKAFEQVLHDELGTFKLSENYCFYCSKHFIYRNIYDIEELRNVKNIFKSDEKLYMFCSLHCKQR